MIPSGRSSHPISAQIVRDFTLWDGWSDGRQEQLEDRGLIERGRLAGAGAADSQRAFFALAPSLSERDYLLTVFRELSHLPAAEGLFDARHNPVWLLGPSAEAARALLEFFRRPTADEPAFRFGGVDTRFLGDLYQDVSDNVKKRYALLQTPRFVESFILDRTLTPAIKRFGLEDATLIDPTCGSGHFLLGGFERLFDEWLRAEPGEGERSAANKALSAVHGADINPYAVAIAKFRLTLAFLEKGGYARLKDAPKLPLHVVVADSLLHNPHATQLELGDVEGAAVADWKGSEFQLEDEAGAREVLYQRYAAVVGNPPYITVKDKALRERYRKMYERSAGGKYSLAAPFCERFFQLGRDRGYVGMITANSFMKREFGKKLISEYLPSVNLESILNTSGAYIPGHGTPTVMLFGTAEKSQAETVRTVLASRGEPSTPADPEQGLVWSSIAQHWDEEGFENDYISVTDTARSSLAEHPWSLGGGGATELKALLEERAEKRLGDVVDSIGFMAITGEDEAFVLPIGVAARHGLQARPFGVGESVRDWAFHGQLEAVFPYTDDWDPSPTASIDRWLYPYRSTLSRRLMFGKTQLEAGLDWRSYRHFGKEKVRTPLSIAFAEVATHNHFVLDRGGKVFKQTAPIIKLPADATEDDHYALLAYLNSSTACFYMKQVSYPKGSAVRDAMNPENNRYAFAGTALSPLPLPNCWNDGRLARLGKAADQVARARAGCAPDAVLLEDNAEEDLKSALRLAQEQEANHLRELVFYQEEIDWLTYSLFDLTGSEQSTEVVPMDERERPFCRIAGASGTASPAASLIKRRCEYLSKNSTLGLFENTTMKRLWRGTSGDTGRYGGDYQVRSEAAVRDWVAGRLEAIVSSRAGTFVESVLRESFGTDARLPQALTLLGAEANVATILREASVPFLSTLTFTESGLEKRAAWEAVWKAQREQDAGIACPEPETPPAYSQGSRGKVKDFLEDSFWDLRGKLDVPKERFISYPGCESDEDNEPVYGWAGWDHLQRAKALAELYSHRKNEQVWDKTRLQPILAGLLELQPWLHQWHNDPSEELGGARPAEQFQLFLEAECAEHGFTHDDLRNWRPAAKQRAARKPSKTKKTS